MKTPVRACVITAAALPARGRVPRAPGRSCRPVVQRSCQQDHGDELRGPSHFWSAATGKRLLLQRRAPPAIAVPPIPSSLARGTCDAQFGISNVARPVLTTIIRVDGAGLRPAESIAGGFGNPPRGPMCNARTPATMKRVALAGFSLACVSWLLPLKLAGAAAGPLPPAMAAAAPLCAGAYADDFAALTSQARDFDRHPEATFSYCTRSSAVYECLSYGPDATVHRERRKVVAHGSSRTGDRVPTRCCSPTTTWPPGRR